MSRDRHGTGVSRRSILAAGTAATIAIVRPDLVRGASANSAVEIGLIGCGGRGGWIANLFANHGGYRIVAAADYFEQRTTGLAERFKLDASRRFSGLSAYKRLLETKLDAVVIESPPYFHPEHAAAAVDAGKHVFVAKPVAVDVPGCLTIADAGRKATEKKLVMLVDFQTRASAVYREAVKRAHNGDIGRIVSGEAVYYCGDTWGNPTYDNTNPEARLRHWGVDKVLSGDVITEQNIHALDVATWILDNNPVKAVGSCGRKARSGSGNVNDHFAVVFTFPDDVLLSFASKQYGQGYDDIGCRVFGARGTIDTHYFGSVTIRGAMPYAGGSTGNLYTDGAVANIAEFHESITGGRYHNPTVAPSVRSNLTTILGRTAAYRRAELTWDQMMKEAEKLEFPTTGLKA